MNTLSIESIPLRTIYELTHRPGLQQAIRVAYHARMLADLRDFAATTEDLLGLPAECSRVLESLDGARLSPGLAHVHAEFSLLIGDQVYPEQLAAVYQELDEVLREPVAAGLTVHSFTQDNLFHRRFRQFALEQEARSAEFDDPAHRVPAAIAPIPGAEFSRLREIIESVLATLKVAAPVAHDDITELVSDIGVFRGRPVRGASAPAFFGCVLVREADEDIAPWIWFADHLTHEAAHHRLYTAIVDDPLVVDDRTVTSPVRKDPRPLSGVVHALYVETKLIDTFRRLQSADVPVSQAELADKLAEFTLLHQQCVEVISEHRDALTQGGRDLLDYCATAV
ncbi:aKG-HExxH-type peptide beta-hydroxylase [Lentzea kentuckyensis]|uniref:aKG-HExxH-type peptide beta-hydroxylase n=1 Tax=Lentzea kentuckyensis TaxID=360086 RepID=UPI000A39A4E6|nr:HEXXH motif-containing putative peptide modification protein [Lentzea kentuckyensis]